MSTGHTPHSYNSTFKCFFLPIFNITPKSHYKPTHSTCSTMSAKGVPLASTREEQMEVARQLRAEQNATKQSKNNRGQGKLAGRTYEGSCRTTPSFGGHVPASFGIQASSRREVPTLMANSVNSGNFSTSRARGGGLMSSRWASSVSQDYLTPNLCIPGESNGHL
jgi:hypothetical protein